MVASSSGAISTVGIGVSGRSFQRSGPPIASSSFVTQGWAISSRSRLTYTRTRSGQLAKCSFIRSKRSASRIATLVPESVRPYSSSGPVHQAFRGVTTAPSEAAA